MRVLFANPPWWEGTEWRFPLKKWRAGVRAGSRWPHTMLVRSRPDLFIPHDYAPYPFFMGYAATYLARATGAEVFFRDSVALRESYESFFRYLQQVEPDYLFIETATPSWDHDSKLIEQIHQRQPRTKIVVTGPITTIKSDEILKTLPVVACIKGEYEKNSVKVVNGAEGVIDFDLLTLQEMNDSPYPYYDDLIAKKYFDHCPKGQKFPHAHVWSSRGCPFKCIFCVWPAAMTGNDPEGTAVRRVRHYSAQYMEGFLREIVGKYRYKSIYFDDDTFNLGNSHVLHMCEVMRKINLPWSAMCRADTCKIETWKVMKESGCFGVKLGFESGSQYVNDKIVNKHLDLEFAREVVHELHRLGLSVHGTFTYGLPGETHEQMLQTRAYRKSLKLTTYQESGAAEIEGTPLHTLRSKGSLAQYDGARIDDSYRRDTDGNKKFQSLVENLRNS